MISASYDNANAPVEDTLWPVATGGVSVPTASFITDLSATLGNDMIMIGDSTATPTVATALQTFLRTATGNAGFTVRSQNIGGTAWQDWVTGQTAFDTAMGYAGTYVLVVLGKNDLSATSDVVWQGRVQATIASIVAAGKKAVIAISDGRVWPDAGMLNLDAQPAYIRSNYVSANCKIASAAVGEHIKAYYWGNDPRAISGEQNPTHWSGATNQGYMGAFLAEQVIDAIPLIDGTPPTISSAAAGATGLFVDLTPSETVVLTSTVPADWSLTYGVSNTAIPITGVSLNSGNIRLAFTATPLYASDTNVKVGFAGGANKVEDSSGNDLATFSNLSVSVAAAPAAPVVTPPATINSSGNVLTVPYDSSVYRTPTIAMTGYTLVLATTLPASSINYTISPKVLSSATPALTINGGATAVTNGSTYQPPFAPQVVTFKSPQLVAPGASCWFSLEVRDPNTGLLVAPDVAPVAGDFTVRTFTGSGAVATGANVVTVSNPSTGLYDILVATGGADAHHTLYRVVGSVTVGGTAYSGISSPAQVGKLFTATEIAAMILATPANKLSTNATGQVPVSFIATDALDANALKADAATEIATAVASSVLATPANKLSTNATGQVPVSLIAADAVNASALATDAVTEIGDGGRRCAFDHACKQDHHRCLWQRLGLGKCDSRRDWAGYE